MNISHSHASSAVPLEEAFRTRRSIRGFQSTEVPQDMVEELLALAGRAPSGSNIQPWKVRVVAGSARTELSAAIREAVAAAGDDRPKATWDYYPTKWREPFLGRRRTTGWGLYGALGIGKGDLAAGERFRLRNYDFFDAPVGMIFTLDEDLSIGSWLDFGIFLGGLTLAARGKGLDTCLQQSFADVHAVLHRTLDIPANEIVICGMALGYADADAPQNRMSTERVPVHSFASFAGFGTSAAPVERQSQDLANRTARVARIVADYDGQGDHRTGTAIDTLSADWLSREVEAAGGRPSLEGFELDRVDPGPCEITVAGRRIHGVPTFDSTGTSGAGIAGTFGPLGSDGKISLIVRPQAGMGVNFQADYDKALAHGQKALVVSVQGKRPGLTLLNATRFLKPLEIPVLQVSSEHGEWLTRQAEARVPAALVMQAPRKKARAFNVTCRLDGERPDLPAVIISTPRSAWWNCASERGGGLACWLEVMRRMAAIRRTRNCLFVAFSGHELDLLGVRHHFKQHPSLMQNTHLWIHFGANLGASNYPMRLQASDMEHHAWAAAIAREAGAEIDPVPWTSATPRGEASVVKQHGIRFVAPVAGSDVFHHPADRWPGAIDIDALTKCVSTGVALAESAVNK